MKKYSIFFILFTLFFLSATPSFACNIIIPESQKIIFASIFILEIMFLLSAQDAKTKYNFHRLIIATFFTSLAAYIIPTSYTIVLLVAHMNNIVIYIILTIYMIISLYISWHISAKFTKPTFFNSNKKLFLNYSKIAFPLTIAFIPFFIIQLPYLWYHSTHEYSIPKLCKAIFLILGTILTILPSISYFKDKKDSNKETTKTKLSNRYKKLFVRLIKIIIAIEFIIALRPSFQQDKYAIPTFFIIFGVITVLSLHPHFKNKEDNDTELNPKQIKIAELTYYSMSIFPKLFTIYITDMTFFTYICGEPLLYYGALPFLCFFYYKN